MKYVCLNDDSVKVEIVKRREDLSDEDYVPKKKFKKSKVLRLKHCCLKYGCGKEFAKKAKLKIHMRESHGYTFKKNFQCPYCKKVCKNDMTFTTHLAVMHRKEVLMNNPEISLNKPCLNCDLKFLNVIDLEKHSLSVHQEFVQPYKCNICNVNVGGKYALTKHKKEKHLEEVVAIGLTGYTKTMPCLYCEKSFTALPQLRNHIYTNHKDKRALHPEIEGLHKCEECGETFYRASARNSHMKERHTPNSKCSLCDKTFSSLPILNDHIRNFHDNTEQICHLCSKMFKGKHNLKNHLKWHSGVKRTCKYKCTLCTDGNFQAEETLQKHIINCHSGIEYKCFSALWSSKARMQGRAMKTVTMQRKLFLVGNVTRCLQERAIEMYTSKLSTQRRKRTKFVLFVGKHFGIRSHLKLM